jgi:tetratricopeptide (TPR) repeat protein
MTSVSVLVRRVTIPALLLLTSLIWPASGLAQATPGSRVLVMPFATDVDPDAPGGGGAALWLGEAASILITEGLASVGVGALSRDERLATFDELNLPMTPALTHATMIRVGELIGASEIVFGEVHLGATLQVHARLIRLAAGRETPAVVEDGPMTDIFDLFARVAGRVASQTGRLRPTATAQAKPLPLEAFENYMKGLVAATPAAQQRFLESAARQAPTDPRILMALWTVYSAQAFHDKALAVANAVTGDTALVRRARFAVALSMIELKRYDGAFQALSTLYAGGHAAAISNAIGIVQLRRGTAPGTATPATYFKRAVDEDPENADYLFNLGYAQALAQSGTEALNSLREAVRFDAADGDAHLVMSAVLAGAGRSAEAQREFDLAKLLGAESDPAARAPGTRIPASLERVPSAPDVNPPLRLRTMVANPAQRDQQQTASFHLAQGRTLMAADRDREATNELRRAIYLAPYEDEPHLLLGQLYQRAGRLPEAIDEFKVALWCRETPAGRLALGTALFESGDRAGAQREASRALVLAPGSAEAQALMRRIGG